MDYSQTLGMLAWFYPSFESYSDPKYLTFSIGCEGLAWGKKLPTMMPHTPYAEPTVLEYSYPTLVLQQSHAY